MFSRIPLIPATAAHSHLARYEPAPALEPQAEAEALRRVGLHAVRLLGFADEGRITARFDLDREEVSELLGDFEAGMQVEKTSEILQVTEKSGRSGQMVFVNERPPA